MSEPLNPTGASSEGAPPATPPAAPAVTLADAQVAAMREQWVSLGLNAAAFDAAAAGGALTDAPKAEEGVTLGETAGGSVFNADQVRQMAKELLKAGVSREQVDAALKADGIELKPEDQLTDEQIELERAFGAAQPHEYKIDYMGRIPAGLDAAGVAQANAEATTWLSEIGFPAEVGARVIEQAMDTGQGLARMSPAERELWGREQDELFLRLAGSPERAISLLEHAVVAINRGNDTYRELLAQCGALKDAAIIMHLAHHGERLVAMGK